MIEISGHVFLLYNNLFISLRFFFAFLERMVLVFDNVWLISFLFVWKFNEREYKNDEKQKDFDVDLIVVL